jgi:hypothetical protein
MARARKQQAEAPAADDGKPKLEDLRKMASDAMDLQDQARVEAQKDQDYYDDIQWTADERKTLEGRGQPCLTFNHIKPAINAIVGIRERSKVDPKAWGRTPKDRDAAEVFTDGLRYVDDVTRFKNTKRDALFQLAIWGITGGLVEVDETGQELKTCKIDPRDYFYDPFSRMNDFSDARYDGVAKWMDADAVGEMHPDYRQHLHDTLKFAPAVPDSFSDKPTDGNRGWADRGKQRLLLIEMYHKHRGEWWKSVFVWGAILESGPSPYLEFLPGGRRRPKKCTVTQSCYVDRENRRYGVVRAMRGPQDAINKARSKAVHLLNNRQVRVDPGVKDVDEVRREAARPDGVFEYRAEQFEILNTHTQFAPAHMELLRDAKGEMQRQSPSPGIVGRQASSQSGIAIQREQEAGLTEQAPLLAAFDDWVLRMYRSMADGIKQFWTDAKHIRVTDDEMAPKFISLNTPEPVMDPQTGQPAIDPMTGQPQMQMHVPAEMDVDIVIDVTPDTAVIQEEQFARLVELKQADPASIPMDLLIEASSLPKKRVLLDKMKQAQEGAPNPLQIEQQKAEMQVQMEMQKAQAQLQTEQQKAQLQIESKAQLNQIDAQAQAEALARQDEYDARKMERAEALEQMKFQHEMQALQAKQEAELVAEARKSAMEAQRRVDELKHMQATKQTEFEFKARDAEFQSKARAKEASQPKPKAEQAKPDPSQVAMGEGLKALAEALSRPKQVIRDASNKVVGVH